MKYRFTLMSKITARGRPAAPAKQQQQKEKLLNATQALLATKPYREVTIREIADHAGLNSAMVRYYFGNKEGLFLVLLDEISKRHFVDMKQISSQEEPIKKFIQFMLNMLVQNNILARLIHDEFSNDNSKLGKAFIERFPKRMAKILPQLIKVNTPITDDIKAKYAAFSLISMIIMPFIGRSVREQAWNIDDEELASSEWAEHIYSMFMSGCGSLTPTKKELNTK